jgi:hypothetical protein
LSMVLSVNACFHQLSLRGWRFLFSQSLLWSVVMPWSVRLQDERGKPVIPEDAGIDFATIPADAGFRLLGYIDPYGDTFFNRVQMKDFLADWDRLNPSSEQREQWKLVRNMATRCRDEAHLYLRFIGD